MFDDTIRKLMQTPLASTKTCIGDHPWADGTEMKMNICILQPDNRINSREYLKMQKNAHSETRDEQKNTSSELQCHRHLAQIVFMRYI